MRERLRERLRLKNSCVHLLSFALPALILAIVYASFGMYPFGDKTVLIHDMNGQFLQFLSYLKQAVFGGEGILYTWSRGLGGSFIGIFAYYASSPFSLLTILFPDKDMPTVLMLLTILKLGCAGLTMSIFLRKISGRKDFSIVIFSVLYGTMSYVMMYSLCIMWLDTVIWLPMVVLGIEGIVQRKKITMYAGFLALTLFSNFYTGYMVCIFSVLYFLLRYFTLYPRQGFRTFLKTGGLFFGSSLGAGLANAWLLLPTYVALSTDTVRGGAGSGYWGAMAPDFFQLLNSLNPATYDTIADRGKASIFCGTLTIALIVLFFFAKKISYREKFMTGILLALFSLCLYYRPLSIIWHLFQAPASFPHRWSFVISFFMVYTAFRVYTVLSSVPRHAYMLSGSIFILLVVLQWSRNDYQWLTVKNILLTALPGIVFLVLLYYGRANTSKKILVTILLLVASCGEMYYNADGLIRGQDNQNHYESYSEYIEFGETFGGIVAVAKERETGFFRMDAVGNGLHNDPMRFGYRGLNHYSSFYNQKIFDSMHRMGIVQGWMWTSYMGSGRIADMLYGMKYLISERDMSDIYPEIASSGRYRLYENKNALPIAFMVPKDIGDRVSVSDVPYQDSMLEAMTGMRCTTVFPTLSREEGGEGVSYRFIAETSDPVYALFSNANTTVEILVNGNSVGSHRLSTHDYNGNVYLGQFSQGEQVTVTVRINSNDYGRLRGCMFYGLNMDKLSEAYDILMQGAIEVEKFSSAFIKGNIEVSDAQLCFTSIPYERGWKVFVDGKQAATKEYDNAYLSFSLPKGTHTVELKYLPEGFTIGLILSFAGILLVLALIYRKSLFKLVIR